MSLTKHPDFISLMALFIYLFTYLLTFLLNTGMDGLNYGSQWLHIQLILTPSGKLPLYVWVYCLTLTE